MKFTHAREPRHPRLRPTGDLVIGATEHDNDEPFVFERDVSREYVERQIAQLQVRSTAVARILLNAYMAYPDMKEQLPLSREVKKHITLLLKDTLRHFKNATTVTSTADEAMSLHILFSDSFDEEEELKKELLQWFKSMVREFRLQNQWLAWCTLVMALSVIEPESTDELNIDNEAWEGVQQYAKDRRDEPHAYIRMIGLAKFIFGEKAKDIPLESKDWEVLKGDMQRYRTIPGSYISYAAEAAMALAERYEILPDGSIHITPRPPKMGATKPVPPRSYV